MSRIVIYNALIVDDGRSREGYVVVEDAVITKVGTADEWRATEVAETDCPDTMLIDAGGNMLIPGAIDEHVHFRDPGLVQKADMATESMAAVAGGVTSFIDMPNTRPATVTMEAVEAKMARAAEVSVANYGFFIGATNDNLDQLLDADYTRVAGVKLFLGSSTGNMLVDNDSTLDRIFAEVPALIAVHAESESVIAASRERLMKECGGSVPVMRHPDVRPREACVEATRHAVELAGRHGSRLHVMHISTADELDFFTPGPIEGKRITAETCPQYLTFDRGDFERLGARIKCNPAIKERSDRDALRLAVADGRIDVIATDHAPHLLADKEGDALTAASGMPMVQFSLRAMLALAADGVLSPEQVVEKMCNNPARLYGIDRRGFVREGYYADLVIVDPDGCRDDVADAEVMSRCGWTPMAGRHLPAVVKMTMVNGKIVYRGGNLVDTSTKAAMPLKFNH
ncbi:MAG: dihydroorotase [Duncaniella sp.]|nr:dihydroorotase [Duncaniella sp.]HBI59477.1 dihydroorotase [Porphyromonadaceae bacterium]